MIQANCRERFTAADFDFIVRTLSPARSEAVSLVELLTDPETRDQILDHERLVAAILTQSGQLRISPQFYFYVLARHALRHAGVDDRRMCDYVGSLLDQFLRTAHLQPPGEAVQGGVTYLSDLLLALPRASPEQTFFLRVHLGNYSLFLTGIFHESIERRRRRRGAPDCGYYEEVGRASYRVVAHHAVARRCELTDVFTGLAEQFHAVRLALNDLADRLLNLDDDATLAVPNTGPGAGAGSWPGPAGLAGH